MVYSTTKKKIFFVRAGNFETIVNIVKQYGEFIRVWLGPELMILVTGREDVEVSVSKGKHKTIEQFLSNVSGFKKKFG